jgi:AcrR family transcriptional regulator
VKSSEKKESILKAAEDCLDRFGYEKTTLDDIGRIVGLNKASLYYYFDSKEALCSEVLFNTIDRDILALRLKVQEVDSCEAQLKTYLVQRLRCFKQLLNLEGISPESFHKGRLIFKKLYLEALKRETDFIRSLLDKGVASGEIADCDTLQVGKAVLAMADGIKHVAFHCADRPSDNNIDYSALEREVAFAVSLVFNGLGKRMT